MLSVPPSFPQQRPSRGGMTVLNQLYEKIETALKLQLKISGGVFIESANGS